MKRTIIVFILILVILAPSSKRHSILDFSIEDLEAYGVAGAMAMAKEFETVPDVKPTPDNVTKCNCVNGKVSYDGGTSLSDCRCQLSDENCGCKSKLSIPDLLPRSVLITHPMLDGKPNCLPCIMVDRNIVSVVKNEAHAKSGWKVGKEAYNTLQVLDLEDPDSRAEIERLGLEFDSVPTFFLIGKKSTKKYVGSMSYNDFIRWTR